MHTSILLWNMALLLGATGPEVQTGQNQQKDINADVSAPMVVSANDIDEDAPASSESGEPESKPIVTAKQLEQKVRRAREKLPREASIEAIIAAASRDANSSLRRIRRWERTTRTSALLPTVRLVADFDMERDESLDRYQEKPDRWGADTDKDMGFQVTTQWELSKLVFNPSELRAHKSILEQERECRKIKEYVTRIYYERKTLMLIALLGEDRNLESIVKRKMRVKELTSQIDALTDGLLSRTLESTD